VVSISSHPVVVGFLDRNYRYKSVTIQIPHDVGLTSMPYTGQKSSPIEYRTSATFENEIEAVVLKPSGHGTSFMMPLKDR
jgi:hypothetical protein